MTVDTAELTWYFATEGVGIGMRHARSVLYGEIKLAHEVDPPGLLPDEVFGSHEI